MNEWQVSDREFHDANGKDWGANVRNHVHLERYLVHRATGKTRRSAAPAEWRSLMA